jgi:hypothetical protein
MILRVVELITIRPPSELFTEGNVLDIPSRQGPLERLCIEMRNISRARGSPDICDDVNAVPLE